MSDTKTAKSGVAMVRVSGPGIRSLREEQSLTQLYLATAVGVTTETISRWERQESPTIKEENGIKLAEVLGVPLQEICFTDMPDGQDEEEEMEGSGKIRPAKIVAMALVALIVISAAALFLFVGYQSVDTFHFSARRIMPAHTVEGASFPVLIEVDFVSDKNSSLLLKEELASGCTVLRSVPTATLLGGDTLKWIDKRGHGRKKFAYMASCSSDAGTEKIRSFRGSLLVRQDSHREIEVDGPDHLDLLEYHWADSDMNNVIDDEELLAVYDDYGTVEGLGVDVEGVESIWMGSGYKWNSKKHVFEIIP